MVTLSDVIFAMSKKSDNINKIGFRLSGFKNWNLKDTLKSISKIGYDGIELCLEHPDLHPDNQARQASEQIQDYLSESDLEISAVSFHGKRMTWKDKTRICLYGIELCDSLNVEVFITGSHIDLTSFNNMIHFTRDMCSLAADSNVLLAVEPEPGTVIAGTKEMKLLYENVDNTNLKINLDIGHSFLTEESIFEDIQYWNDRIVHTHIEDTKSGIHRHLIPGEGDIPFNEVFDAFSNIAFNGYYTIDVFDIESDPDYYAKQCFQQIKRIIENSEYSG